MRRVPPCRPAGCCSTSPCRLALGWTVCSIASGISCVQPAWVCVQGAGLPHGWDNSLCLGVLPVRWSHLQPIQDCVFSASHFSISGNTRLVESWKYFVGNLLCAAVCSCEIVAGGSAEQRLHSLPSVRVLCCPSAAVRQAASHPCPGFQHCRSTLWSPPGNSKDKTGDLCVWHRYF